MSAVPVSAVTPKVSVAIRMIEVKALRASKTNPRTGGVDAESLAELAASIKEKGVLEPILVRSAKDGFEIIAGERRWRAARQAGLAHVPAIVRDDLDPKQVLEVQVIENLQRANLSPMEEAEAFDRLRKECSYSVRDLMARVSKSESYVHSRLALLALPASVRKALAAREITEGVAVLVARLPHAKLREDAASVVLRPDDPDGPMGYREAADYVRQHFMLALKGAPFSLEDAQLVPAAGACTQCPKRTGANRALFGDLKQDDLCTDSACFSAKREAAWVQTARKAKEKGLAVLNDDEARKVLSTGFVSVGSDFVDLEEACPQDPKRRTWGRVLGKAVPQVKLARDPHDFRVHRLVTRNEARKALAEAAPELVERQKPALTAPQQKVRSKEREKAERDRLVATAARAEIVKRAEAKVPLAGWRFLCHTLLEDAWTETVKELSASRCPLGTKDVRAGMVQALGRMNEREVRGLIFDVLLSQKSRMYGTGFGHEVRDACRAFGVDVRKVAAKAVAQARKAKKAK